MHLSPLDAGVTGMVLSSSQRDLLMDWKCCVYNRGTELTQQRAMFSYGIPPLYWIFQIELLETWGRPTYKAYAWLLSTMSPSWSMYLIFSKKGEVYWYLSTWIEVQFEPTDLGAWAEDRWPVVPLKLFKGGFCSDPYESTSPVWLELMNGVQVRTVTFPTCILYGHMGKITDLQVDHIKIHIMPLMSSVIQLKDNWVINCSLQRANH